MRLPGDRSISLSQDVILLYSKRDYGLIMSSIFSREFELLGLFCASV
jgi:hypothetical protein